MAAIHLEPGSGEQLFSGRRQRVAVGADRRVVELDVGDPWPLDVPGRIDLLVRTGHVLRFRDGNPDPHTIPHLRRVGLPPIAGYPARQWARRAAEFERRNRTVAVGETLVRVLSGRPDGDHDLVLAHGRAFVALRGREDEPRPAGVGASALPGSGGDGPPGPRRRPRRRRKA